MRLVDVIEECSLCHTPDQVIWQIIKAYTPDDISRLVKIFLDGIGSQHQVPGKLVATLQDIRYNYLEYGQMSRDQKILMIGEIIRYWQEMTCESRANLLL